jgi:toxin CcdB
LAQILVAQFDVYRNPRSREFPLLLDIQADLLSKLATRVVVPLTNRKRLGRAWLSRLNPVVEIADTQYAAIYQELAAIPTAGLGERVCSLALHRAALISALDLLMTGS